MVSQIAVTKEYIHVYIYRRHRCSLSEDLTRVSLEIDMFVVCALMSLLRKFNPCAQIECAPPGTLPKVVQTEATHAQISTHEPIQTFTKSLREVIEDHGYGTACSVHPKWIVSIPLQSDQLNLVVIIEFTSRNALKFKDNGRNVDELRRFVLESWLFCLYWSWIPLNWADRSCFIATCPIRREPLRKESFVCSVVSVIADCFQ